MHFVVAFAYCKVYNSFWIGFAVATPIIFVGCMLGALFAIILSRYLIANFIKKQILSSNGKFSQKFKVAD